MELMIRMSRLVQVIMFPNLCGPRKNRKTLFSAPKRRSLRGACTLARTPVAFDGPIFALRQQTSTQARRIVPACLAGLGVLYLVGLPYMYLILNVYLDKGLSIWYVVRAGMLIYLPGDFLKIAVTTLLARPLKRALPH